MAITQSDIKLLASQDLTDHSTSGGAMTSHEIVDGNVNNLFPDISRLDRTIGRVSLRKAFVAVQTANTDTYYGAHAIVTDPPDDDGVSVTIFQTGEYGDRRDDAKSKLESYVVESVLSRIRLYDNQLEGQKNILGIMRPDIGLPEIGEVYCLIENEDQADEYHQFVRVTSLEHEVQTFTDSSGDYEMRVVTLGISDALRYTFHGGTPARYDTEKQATDSAVLRETSVADASKYYGVTKLAQDISANDLTLSVDSIYQHIVPSAQSEAALSDIQAGGESARSVTSGSPVSVHVNGYEYYIGSGMQRGSITLTSYGSTYKDDGAGNLIRILGDNTREFSVLNYETGHIRSYGGGSAVVEFTPAVQVTDVAETTEIEVTIANRASTYVKTLNPPPAPGSLNIDFMSLGKWYRLRDRGDGSCTSDLGGSVGVASVNYATGAVTITLGSLPDADTSILFAWGGVNHYVDLSGDNAGPISAPGIQHTVSEGSVAPNSLTISWQTNGVTKTATDNGKGLITGDAEGRVIYSTGEIFIAPNQLPDAASNVTFDYDSTVVTTETFTPTATGGQVSFTLANGPVRPGSISAKWQTDWYQKNIKHMHVYS